MELYKTVKSLSTYKTTLFALEKDIIWDLHVNCQNTETLHVGYSLRYPSDRDD